MNTGNQQIHNKHFDLRIALYRAAKQFLVILILGLIIKYAFCDSVLVKTDQMTPIIQKDDRILFSKIKYVLPLKWICKPRRGDVVIFNYPNLQKKTGCLRIAGRPGDIISIKDGAFSILNKPEIPSVKIQSKEEFLPPEYSSRDNMKPFRIPIKGDTIKFDTLCVRDFILMYSIVIRENPKKNYKLDPLLYIDDSLTKDYIINNFALYNGMFSDIPDTFFVNWFFWERLEKHIISSNEDKRNYIKLSLLSDSLTVTNYKIKKNFYFLLSDDWYGGYDSRYFGPVCLTCIKGRVICTLWSFSTDKSGNGSFRWERICKIVK